MKQQVDQTVEGSLKNLDIPKVVEDRVRAESGTYIKAEVEREVSTGLTHALIMNSAKDAATRTAIETAEPIARQVADRKAAEAFEQRHLSDAQKKRLVELLSPGRNRTVRVRSRDYTAEESIYGDDFVEVLKNAGWQALDDLRVVHLTTAATFRGVALDVPDKNHVALDIQEFRKKIEAVGISVTYIEGVWSAQKDQPTFGSPYIVIGER